jgi:pilus assembly protein CpaF
VVGLGPLQALVEDQRTTDVLVLGPAATWVDRGRGLERVAVGWPDEASLQAFAVRLASLAGRRLDPASAFADVPLPGGIRLHAVLPPVSVDGTCLSLRIIRSRGLALPDLVGDPVVRDRLTAIVRARLNVVVSGGTGSGKTTVLQALLGAADPLERIVIVEDVTELAPRQPHVVRLQARPANAEGAGSVPLRDLVRQALRMRPDRLVVGEARGAEVADLLLALNTGHEGGATTLHANGVGEVLPRLQALGGLAGLPPGAVDAQVVAGLHAVVHLRRRGTVREVGGIGAVCPGPEIREDLDRLAALVEQRGVPWPG